MRFWPFSKRITESDLSAEQLRSKLIEAAYRSPRQLAKFCRQNREVIARHAEAMRKLPDEVKDDPKLLDVYMGALIAAAQCLERQLNDPRLMRSLTGDSQNNPILRWDKLLSELPKLLDELQYDEAESRLQAMLVETGRYKGSATLKYSSIARGRLAECSFHRGRIREAEGQMHQALELCRENGDDEGVVIYLSNLIEVYRYLDEIERAAACCDELAARFDVLRRNADSMRIRKRAALIRAGEPLNRVVVRSEDDKWELDELRPQPDGKFEFVFERNRPQLAMCVRLTRKGVELASQGQHAAALEFFERASEIDPYDPDPVFQGAVSLMELGAYVEARKGFEEVERLAPGWFRCRQDRWLAEQLETGKLPYEAMEILHLVEDAHLPPPQRVAACRQAIERFDATAPLWLAYGDSLGDQGAMAEAERAYRKGLACAEEPDVETRLLVALAGILPSGSAERQALVARALELSGSLVSRAAAKVIQIMERSH